MLASPSFPKRPLWMVGCAQGTLATPMRTATCTWSAAPRQRQGGYQGAQGILGRRALGHVKARTELVALLAAGVTSTLGSTVSVVAIPWLVLVTTGKPADLGLVIAAAMVPYLFASVF